MKPTCPLCARRRASRACPATGQRICAVCCGTKRLVEIDCPPDCGYLRSSQAHPPAVVQRQQERDMLFVFQMVQGLTAHQQEILVLLQGCLRTERPDAAALVDADAARAARALAETYETASRGIIYEHVAALPAAARLGADIKTLIERARGQGAALRDADLAVVLRRVERAADTAAKVLPGGDTAYLELLKRVFRDTGQAGQSAPDERPGGDGPRLIIPGG